MMGETAQLSSPYLEGELIRGLSMRKIEENLSSSLPPLFLKVVMKFSDIVMGLVEKFILLTFGGRGSTHRIDRPELLWSSSVHLVPLLLLLYPLLSSFFLRQLAQDQG